MIKEFLKHQFSKFPKIEYALQRIWRRFFPVKGKANRIEKKGILIGCRFDVIGDHNRIVIEKGAVLIGVLFHVRGGHHTIIVGKDCRFRERGEFWCEGEGNTISIGTGTTIVSGHLCAQEKGTVIQIGRDCMFSNHIQVRTSDSHPLYDRATRQRINPAADVHIADHVWICAEVTVMKGTQIEQGAVVGFGSIAKGYIPANSLAVGVPAKVVKKNVCWDRKIGHVPEEVYLKSDENSIADLKQ